MANQQPAQATEPALSERARRYQQEVERVVREVGEHPLYELKRWCAFDQLADKIEFTKDVQSICASKIEFEKYLVIGADAATRSFVGVDNVVEFDEAKIRQRLAKYLHPVPLFEPFFLESSDGKKFVFLVFPRQKTRRILAKVTVEDSSIKPPKLLLREGDLWTKGQSTAKRLATAEDWDDIYEELIELETERRTRQRTAHFLERATAQGKLRGEYGLTSIPSFGTDEEFKALVENLCVSQDRNRFLVLLEHLRDDLVEEWHSVGAFGLTVDPVAQTDSISTLLTKVREHKINVFLPAMHRLTLAAIYIIKNSGTAELLRMTIQLLEEVYETTNNLTNLRWLSPRGLLVTGSKEHVSHTFPALEALISLHLIGAYAAKRKKVEYLPILLRRVVRAAGGDAVPEMAKPMAFWPFRSGWREPESLRYRNGRINLCAERVESDSVFLRLFGSATASIEALCQYECLLEFNSFLAVEEKSTPDTVVYMRKQYPGLDFTFWPSLVAFPLENIKGIALKLFTEIKSHNLNALKPVLFDDNLAGLLRTDGEKIFVEFLSQLEQTKDKLALELRSFHFGTDWPKEIAEALKRADKGL